jgi:hypothetical protein
MPLGKSDFVWDISHGKLDTYGTAFLTKYFFTALQHFPHLICTNSVKTLERKQNKMGNTTKMAQK